MSIKNGVAKTLMAMAQGPSIRRGKNHTKEKERAAKSVQPEEKENVSLARRKLICMRAKKTKRFSLVVKHTLERDIIIDFYNSGLIMSLSRGFSIQVKKGFPHKSLCSCV